MHLYQVIVKYKNRELKVYVGANSFGKAHDKVAEVYISNTESDEDSSYNPKITTITDMTGDSSNAVYIGE